MKTLLLSVAAFAGVALAASSVHEFGMKTIDGQSISLGDYKGKTLLLVNVASKCGYTPQYAGLQSLYEKYKDRGLVVIGIPANDFGAQEPGTEAEIKTFCTRKYNVSFPMLAKVSVVGAGKAPLYQYLTGDPSTRGEVKWNFTKFLVGPDGRVLARFEPGVTPDSPELIRAVEKSLSK